jgi:pimeloyl-ACP methyl ester carboxylesterase
MGGWLTAACLLLPWHAGPAQTLFGQVAPAPAPGGTLVRSAGQDRAVVLIHGLHLHPLDDDAVPQPELSSWQQPDATLVKALQRDADVFAFAYGQSVPVEDVAELPGLGDGVRRLCGLGYRQVVLVGFSAGGLVARHFAEDHPDAGVTKVVQVDAPNGGSAWAHRRISASPSQQAFLESLTPEGRARVLRERAGKAVPDSLQFVCVVGTRLVYGDIVVKSRDQWPEDLQRQGIPAVAVPLDHLHVMTTKEGAGVVARMVREDQPRWDADQVSAMRKRLWGVFSRVEP